MTRIFGLRTLAVTLALVFSTSTASAAPLIYTVSGFVDTTQTETSGSFPLGAPFSVSFLIDSTAAPLSSSSMYAQYQTQVLDINTGSYQMVSTAVPDPPTITVGDELIWQDSVDFRTYVTGDEITWWGGVTLVDEIYVRLEDESSTALDSTALPLQFDLADFSSARFIIYAYSNDNMVNIEGPITSITVTAVPEPKSCLLLGTGLLGLVAYARRRRRTA